MYDLFHYHVAIFIKFFESFAGNKTTLRHFKQQESFMNLKNGFSNEYHYSHGTGRSTRQGVWLSEKLVKRFLNGGNACEREIGKRDGKRRIIMR